MVVEGPAMVGGEAHGRLGASALLHGMNPTTHLVIQILALLGMAVLALAVADLLLRGRFRTTALALTGMLASLAPLMGVYAAANALLFAFIEVADRNIAAPSFIAIPLAEAAYAVAVGALVGGGAVVLKAVLRLADAWKPKTSAGPQPRATNP